MEAPLIPNESARLDALLHYNILDTPPETAFDELTQLAAQICQTPMASLTFIDQNRQWHKSNYGVEFEQIGRDVSFCAHTVARGDLLVVPDAQSDERFHDNPFVAQEAGLRFYAGMPLVTPEGLSVGSLCVFDTVPHELAPQQLEALRILGHQAVAHLELRPDISDKPPTPATFETSNLAAPSAPSRRERLEQRRLERLRAADDLRRADQRYRDLFEAMREGVLLIEARSGTLEASSSFVSEITGATPLLGRRVWQVAALQPLFPGESKWALVRQNLAKPATCASPKSR